MQHLLNAGIIFTILGIICIIGGSIMVGYALKAIGY